MPNQDRSGFNLAHPEMVEGEMFLTNDGDLQTLMVITKYKTLRMGKIAYTPEGDVLDFKEHWLLPTFINKREFERRLGPQDMVMASECSYCKNPCMGQAFTTTDKSGKALILCRSCYDNAGNSVNRL